MNLDDLPLFAWSPPECEVKPFPLAKRVAKIRDVAAKLITKRSAKHVEQYRDQVESALEHQLQRSGVGADCYATEIAAFWRAVGAEAARLDHRHHSGPGAA